MQACMFLLSVHIRSFLSSFFSNIIVINLFFIIIIIIIMMIIFYLLSIRTRALDINRINFQGASFCPKIASFATHLFFFFSLFVNYRIVLVLPSLSLCFPIDAKAKFYRSQSEVLSNIYRTSIEDLSKTYRRPIEDLSNIYRTSIEDLSKRVCVNCFIGCPVNGSKFRLLF